MPGWIDMVYAAYAGAVMKSSTYRAIASDALPVVECLTYLEEDYGTLDRAWEYGDVDRRIQRMLRAVRRWSTASAVARTGRQAAPAALSSEPYGRPRRSRSHRHRHRGPFE